MLDHLNLSDAELLALLKVARAAAPMQAPATLSPIEPVDRSGPLPLSFAQQRLWFVEQLGDAGAAYHIPTRMRLKGALHRDALVRALDRIVARHEALRTVFHAVDGKPVQRIVPVEQSRFHLVEHELSGDAAPGAELRRVMAEEAGTRFDLERGPLIRGRLVRRGVDDHLLLVTMHHIVSDGWSMDVFKRELGALYTAFRAGQPDPLPALSVQYADYAVWQRKWVDGEVLKAQAEYWTRTLGGAPELLELPTDHVRPARQDFSGGAAGIELDAELTAGLTALSRRRGATLFMTLLAGWAAVLSRLSGQGDVVIGTPTAGRGRREIEGLIGFFVNTLPIRVDVSGALTVGELLERVKERALGAQHNQDIPFEQVVELLQPVRSLAYTPVSQVMFTLQNAPRGEVELSGLAAGSVGPASRAGAGPEPQVTAKFDLSLVLSERGGRVAGTAEYAAALFERATIERWLGYLRRVLGAMVLDEGQRVEALPLLGEGERRRVVHEWNATAAAAPGEPFVHALFEAQARRTPGAAALVFESETLSYAELNARANRLAHHLRALGVGPDARVAICVERGPAMVVGALAVLKAGGAYLPLDPAYPHERLRYTLEDGDPVVLLTGPALLGLFADVRVPVLDLEAPRPAWADEPETDPERGALSPAHLAYVIYTSGSTGRPKGVRVEHLGLVATLATAGEAFGFGPGDRVPSMASFAFDIWLFETLLPLLAGSRVRLVPRERVLDVPRLVEDLSDSTALHAVPALMRRIVEEVRARPGGVLPALRTAFVGGDAVAPDLLEGMREAFPAARINVLYGPTEATIICASHLLPQEPASRRMVGRPLGNAALYVLDAAGGVAPVGAPGELCLGGASVARDYLGRPGLTAERFVPDPFSAEPGARLYRTGDRVRWLASGEVEFLGRTDHQVKVRGFRIEPGEIEARLREHAGVREAVVVAREDTPGEKRLVAYVVGEETAGAQVLRAHLGARLPEHMVPAAYVRLETLPLTPSGKLDRRALPAPEGEACVSREYEPPVNQTEEALAAIWAEVLRTERVGRHDNFFERGGHSLLAVQVISRVRQVLGAEVALGELFARPVLSDFARALETAGRAELPPIEPADRAGRVPLSFAQQRLWFLEQLGDLGSTYHMSQRQRLRGELDRAALARALDRIVARHESLRTVFAEVDGVPEQRIAPAEASRFHLAEHDLGGGVDAKAELGRLMAEEAHAPFDLERGPLIRGRLVRLAADDHVLLLTMHHIVSDGWSMGVLTREISALYEAFRRGAPDPLPALRVQYADYAIWQRRRVEGEVLREQAEYWTRTLAGAPELLELPTDHPRPRKQDFAGDSVPVVLSSELAAGLKALSRRQGTTLFMTLLAGWAAVLSRLSGKDDVVVGTPTANRGQREVEELIGFFVNTLALRLELSGAPSAAELLGRVRERALGAQHHQDIPFEQVVERVSPARSMAHHPLFQVMFAWQNALQGRAVPGPELPGPNAGAGAGTGAGPSHAKFDLSLALQEAGDRIAGSLEYATALFERETVERWVGYLRHVLEQMAADESRRVERLALMPADERARVVAGWNATDAAFPRESCVHELFVRQVERAPDAVAVVDAGISLTYAELNARANRLAHHLRSLGVGPDARVALAMPRSAGLVEAELAILKCGAAYVPLDPGHPGERLREVLDDSAPAALLTTSELAERFAGLPVPVVAVDAGAPAWASLPETNPAAAGVTAEHLAYVTYTSGSTGRPKGVMVAHRSVLRLVFNNRYVEFGPRERVAFAANPAFDATTMEVWAPLLTGGRVVVIGRDVVLDPDALARTLADEGVTALFITTAVFNHYAATIPRALAALRHLMTGGERADPASFARVLACGGPVRLIHCYGPTETTTFAITGLVERVDDEARSLPLGRPIGNTRVYLLDTSGEPVPVGVAGELCIGGAGVARGYLGRRALTAERFVPDPFGAEAGARLYRTGDLGRWLPDGTIEFVGRNDFQVKVRGFRIEPGEIEARLLEHPAVREAIVLAREDVPGEKRLVAYVVGEALADVLRAHLADRLPEYMVPAAYVRLETLPLTPNGKLDRKALPAPEAGAYAAREYEPPVGETEAVVAEVWAEVLRVERVGRHDDFFELGGHSLLAVQVISRVRQALEVEVALGDLFTRPVLSDFARELAAAARAELPPIEPAPREGRVPLSFAQQRLWFLEQLGNLGSTYHVATRLRLRGELDRAALVRALDAVVARHEALRTVFAQVDGVPEQRIAPADIGFHLVEHDRGGDLPLSARNERGGGRGEGPDAQAELGRLLAEEADAPFDLERGPLIRGRLIRLAADDHVLPLTMHHIVSDGWSMGVLTREISALYAAFRRGEPDPLPALPIQYADYAVWQRRWVEGELLREQADYWTRTLAGAPELLKLPTDHPRPAEQDHAGAWLGVELDEELTAGLKALSRRHGTTLFMTLLAGWATLLGRLSGQGDVVVGTPTAGRGRREIEGLIGFFVNTLALRVDLSDAPTVAELLGRVKRRALGAQQNQDIPFEQVVERVDPVRSLSHSPLFQAMFAWQNLPGGGRDLPGRAPLHPGAEPGAAAAAPLPAGAASGTVHFDLSLTLSERGGRIAGSVEYATALFETETVERWLGYLRRVLAEMVADERRSVARLELMPPAERAQVVEEWNATELPCPDDGCLHELFERRARETPDAMAVVFEGGELTYAQLNARANRLAHHLRALGVGPDARVALCAERTPEMVAGLLAVLKAGGAYVPLDPAYPEERLRWLLDDSAPVAVLAHGSLAARFAGAGVPVIELDAGSPVWTVGPETNPGRGALLPEHLAYVIYTSGSTGRPKGVMVTHRAVGRQVAAVQAGFGLEPGDRSLQFASIAFDASVEEIFGALVTGAALVLRTEAWLEGAHAFWGRCAENRVTVVDLPTRFWQLLLDEPSAAIPECVRLLAIGGEAVEPAALEAWFLRGGHRPRLLNTYGPTETTVNATLREIVDDPATWRSIGRPVANTRVYLLDARGEPVPVGVAGELYIGGGQVARGYFDRPGLTAGRFVPDPFASEPGARLYRTGDRVRWLPEGSMEFLGRTDFQVKIRGFRIELGEIEARLAEHPEVSEAVVLVREGTPGEKRLVAYIVGSDSVEVDALRAHLSERLPSYMVPAAFVRLDAFPITAGGKVDRRALPAPEGDALATRGYEAPEGETETALGDIWAEVLRVERVGRRDSFFELGGHSLLAVQVISRVRQRLEVEVALGDLFTRPVLADFARELEARSRAELPPIELADRRADLPLSFAQQRLWFIDQLEGAGSAYHMPTRLRLKGELDRAALVRALDRIVARHEALRTVFVETDGDPVQRIAPAGASTFHLVDHDLRGHAQAGAELGRVMAEEAGARFDLARGPLIRGRLVRLADDDHVLLITMHHIVSDGWSMGVLTHEISALYAAFRAGQPDPLPPLPVQYADYAAWQRRWVEGEVLRRQAEYWKETLAGAPELLELPTDHARPARQDFSGAGVGIELSAELAAALRALSRRHGTTLFMTLMAGWAAVLARLSGQDDVVVGTPSANRGRREIEGLIGFFVNTLALRVDLSGSPAVAEALARVKVRALEAQANQDIPFEQVVELVQPARSLAHSPLFQVMFVWQNAPEGQLELPGLAQAPLGPAPRSGPASGPAPQATAKFDLMLALGESGDRISGAVEYATSLFERETVERWMGYLRRVLEAMAADDGSSVERLPMLSEGERTLVLREWNATEAEVPREACIHELFEAQAARTPGATALVFEGERLSYAELNARANRLAHHLRALGVGPDARVGICVERSVEMVVGLLAILKAGGAYVPLDAGYPVDRLRNMVEDSVPAVLLTHPPVAGVVAELTAGSSVPVVDLAGGAAWAHLPETNPGRGGLTPESLGYVIFTSGSTGRPKGVMLEHGSLVNRLAWMQDRYGMTPDEALLQKTPFSFDVSFWEFFWPLMVGARLVVARPGGHREPAYLADLIQREGITHAHFVPSMLQLFLEHPDASKCTGLLRVPVSGEAVSAALVRHFHERLPGVELTNQYGPTESGEVTEWACDPDAERVSIGRAIHNSTVYVVDRAGQPAPVGVAGELFIGGIAVARGYLGRPALTAERFVPDPFGAPGARAYRTGDLCRWRADGNLEFLGRTDFQVKVRGFRVELGEIEARLAGHPAVREAVVVALDDGAGATRLAAWYTADAPVEAGALREHLAGVLPEYMIPAALVWMAAFPVTPNGKLDRRALPAPEADAFATSRGHEPPLGETEEALAAIWSELLGVERVGRRDDFFALGGHSLRAVQVVSRVRQSLGIEAEVGDLFVRPVLADFARGLADAGRAELPPITPADRGAALPLSFAQQRLWFMERMEGTGSAYHVPTRMRLRGKLDRDALVRALDRILARHEALRTVFAEVDGSPVQRIAPAEESRFALAEHDLSGRPGAGRELARLAAEDACAPFDLARGPLIRGMLVRMAEDDHVLLVTMHHIVSDGWSMGVFTRELGTLYGAFREGLPDPLPPLPIQYADYAAWQRRWMEGEVLRTQADHWRRTLSGAPELLELPTDHARPARQDFTGATVGLVLDEGLSAALKELSRRHGTTLYMTLLAGWAAVLSRLSGQSEVVVGTPTANRGRREIEGLIGFFVNMLPVRVELSDAPTVAELLARVRERALGAQHHQDIPFEQVVELVHPARSMAHAPLFQAMFTWQNAPGGGAGLPGLTLAPMGPAEPSERPGAGPIAPAPSAQAPSAQVTANVDLSLALLEHGGRIAGSVTYATALFERETVERWVGYLRRVLEGMVADETRRVDRLEIVAEDERRRMVEEWNRTDAAAPGESCVHALFEAQVARTPDAEAVVFDCERFTYAELNAAANRLARRLRAAGVGSEARVGVMLERSAELVVALLAVLKAGGAYLPLDPALPAARRAALAADAGAAVLVTREPALEGFAGTIVSPAEAEGEDGDDLCLDVQAAALAYVIYTSGSTGTPKGVGVAHAEASAHCRAAAAAYGLTPADRVLQFAAVGFDVSVEQMLAPLSAGACVVVRGNEVPTPLELARRVAAQRLTVINPPTAYWHQLAADPDALELLARTVRLVIAGGEAMSPAAAREWASGPAAGVRLLNGYGPTETVVTCTAYDVPAALPEGATHVPVGRPFGGRTAYVLDGRGEPAPLGVPGELCIGGVLARGYLGRPAATAAAFVPDPFSATPGARMYRTGDRARWLAAGELEFLGRRDFQVKIRGFRIEPGEVEARLAEHPEVREAVVLAREDVSGDRRLVAYVVASSPVEADALRAHLGAALPAYMVPSAFVRLDALPLTSNGKVDRRALPAPDAPAARTYEAPVGETEEALAEIFAEVLGVERVGRRDNFFELGGHSLLAVRVISRVRQVLEAEVVLAHVFSHPTVESLAARLTGADDRHRSDRAIAIRPTGSRPPLFLAYDGMGSTLYAQVLHPHIDAEIPVYALPAPGPSEPPLRTVEGMAARLVRMIREVQPSGPYRLAGWSFGGVLSYEVAVQLIGRDEVVEFVGMFDSGCPADFTAAEILPTESRNVRLEHAFILHGLRTADTTADGGGAESDEEIAAAGDEDLETFVRKCREKGLLPRHVTVAQARAVRDRLRGCEVAWGEYSPQPVPVLVHQFPAGDSSLTDPTRGWGAFHPQGWLRVTPVPGTHLSMMRAPNAATLGEALSRALGRVREKAAPISARSPSPLVTLQGGAAGVAPLFCVPGAGSGVTTFIDLMSALGPSVPVHGLQPRGMDAEAPPHATVQAAAEHYLGALREACPAGPVHLLGHSFGGWVALEMALRLHEAGRPPASLTILDSEVPHDSEAVIRECNGGEAFLKLVEVLEMSTERSLGIGPAEVASRDEAGWLKLLHGKMVELGLMGARAKPEVLTGPFRTFARCVRTAYRPSGVYPGPLRLVLVDDPTMDEAANRAHFAEVERGWREWAPGLVFSTGAGNHFTALKTPHVAVLAALLAEDRRAGEG